LGYFLKCSLPVISISASNKNSKEIAPPETQERSLFWHQSSQIYRCGKRDLPAVPRAPRCSACSRTSQKGKPDARFPLFPRMRKVFGKALPLRRRWRARSTSQLWAPGHLTSGAQCGTADEPIFHVVDTESGPVRAVASSSCELAGDPPGHSAEPLLLRKSHDLPQSRLGLNRPAFPG
jgi:hypothetical protein